MKINFLKDIEFFCFIFLFKCFHGIKFLRVILMIYKLNLTKSSDSDIRVLIFKFNILEVLKR